MRRHLWPEAQDALHRVEADFGSLRKLRSQLDEHEKEVALFSVVDVDALTPAQLTYRNYVQAVIDSELMRERDTMSMHYRFHLNSWARQFFLERKIYEVHRNVVAGMQRQSTAPALVVCSEQSLTRQANDFTPAPDWVAEHEWMVISPLVAAYQLERAELLPTYRGLTFKESLPLVRDEASIVASQLAAIAIEHGVSVALNWDVEAPMFDPMPLVAEACLEGYSIFTWRLTSGQASEVQRATRQHFGGLAMPWLSAEQSTHEFMPEL